MDWAAFVPRERAVLVFVVRGATTEQPELLLIRKKRGLGAGKINGPGGRLEPGESACEAALRECQEELCITPVAPEALGELAFQFTDGYSLACTVFRAEAHLGTPTETEEASPLWTDARCLPYEEMWEDDQHWLPHLLAGRRFRGRFVFDGDRMLAMELSTEP
jgi:8-oxo-dGTP diphosphatase